MFCSKCGKELSSDACFCQYCGAPIDKPKDKPIGRATKPMFNAGGLLGGMKSKLSQVASDISDKVNEATSPVELVIPEGGVKEPAEYEKLGSHIEIVSMTSANVLDARNPYTVIVVDDEFAYVVKDGQKINIPTSNGTHKIKIRSRGSQDTKEITLSDTAYLKIRPSVSNKVLVSRTLDLCESKNDFEGLYAESIIPEEWTSGWKHVCEDPDGKKSWFSYVYPDCIVILKIDGTKETVDLWNQRSIVGQNGSYTLTDISGNTKHIDTYISPDAYIFLDGCIRRVNADNPEFLRDKSFDVSFGKTEFIQISGEQNLFRIVDKSGKVVCTHSLDDIIQYKVFENTPAKEDALMNAIAGSQLAGKDGAFLGAMHAQRNNNSIYSYELWITVKEGNSTAVKKVMLGKPTFKFERNSEKHLEYMEEYNKFDAYMKSRR